MKKVLLIVIVFLLILLTYFSFAKGVTIASIKISSIDQIKDKNDDLDAEIDKTNQLIDTKYPGALSSLKTASNNLAKAKKEYLTLSQLSSEEDIIKATMEESYDIGILWTKIGNYARSKGTNVEMSVQSGNSGLNGLYNLNFTVNGTYVAIISFVEAMENDSLLNFRIRNFKLLPHEGSILQATFTVTNVAIDGNTSKLSVSQ